MKNFIFVLSAFVFSVIQLSYAQSPHSINYQAVVRDVSGQPVVNQNVSVRVSILAEVNQQQTVVYSETHLVTTNDYGLFSLKIGEGNPVSGVFEDIDWLYNHHRIKIEADHTGGNNYQLLGIIELSSVPYALMSKRTGILTSDDRTVVVSRKNVPFPLDTTFEYATMNVFVRPVVYNPNEQHLDGLSIINNENTPGDVSLKLVSRSNYTWNNIHMMSTVVLSSVASGPNMADFVIQNEYAGPNLVSETFRIKYNGNVGIGSEDPQERLQVSNGNIYLDEIGSGVIMKSPNGNCWLFKPDNSGNLQGQAIPCP